MRCIRVVRVRPHEFGYLTLSNAGSGGKRNLIGFYWFIGSAMPKES
jgi:hypothetical protein